MNSIYNIKQAYDRRIYSVCEKDKHKIQKEKKKKNMATKGIEPLDYGAPITILIQRLDRIQVHY